MPRPVPAGYHTISPYLIVRGAADAIDFYTQAFGAHETGRMAGPDGRVMHAELKIGDSRVMLTEETPAMNALSPQSLNGSPVSLFLYVEDVDAQFARAVEAGATPVQQPADMFWGDRWGMVTDPFGHSWQLATRLEDLTHEQVRERMATAKS